MSSFFRYPGGKAKLCGRILHHLSRLMDDSITQYRELFFGGGSVGIKYVQKKECPKQIWLNDKDVGIACLWTSVIRYPDSLKKLVLAYKPTVDSFYQLKNDLLNTTSVPDTEEEVAQVGFNKLALHQITYSGLGLKSGGPLGGVAQLSKYKVDCRWSPAYICKKINTVHKVFSNKEVIHEACTSYDFEKIITDTSMKALLYLDPPYFVKGSQLYHESFTHQDHTRLCENLKNTQHKWLLSYDACEEIKEMYSWATIEEVEVNYSITASKDTATGARQSRTKKEFFIYPSITT